MRTGRYYVERGAFACPCETDGKAVMEEWCEPFMQPEECADEEWCDCVNHDTGYWVSAQRVFVHLVAEYISGPPCTVIARRLHNRRTNHRPEERY